jgi:16S rRNA (cytosine1402-N4)-methyltransferase
VVSFHSLEDRVVKRFFAPEKTGPAQSRHLPRAAADTPRWRSVAKPVKAGAAEVAANPRARSAVLRSATRSEAAARVVRYDGLGVPDVRGVS